ncbi:MAG: fibronectin type III domain-containing protein [Syntrophobacteraceae bacterium]
MITKTKPRMSVCLAACLLAGLLCADVAFATVLTVPQEWQEQDQWCWDATSQAILQFYGVSKTQTQIAAYGTPGSADTWNYLYGVESDPPPMRYGVDYILNYFAGLTATGHGVALSKAVVTSQINSLRPVGIRWGWDTGGGHILAIKGITGNTVYLMDPWNGDAEMASYNWVVRSASDGHTWTDSLTISNAPPISIATINGQTLYSCTTTNATLGANIVSDGAAVPTASGVAYGKNINPTVSRTKKATAPTVTTGTFSVNVTRLASNTVYYFRGYATNRAGTAYTAASTFTTLPGAPKATAATLITANSFTAHWKAPSGNAQVDEYYLLVATDAAFTNLIYQGTVSGTSLAVTVPGEGKYYYKVEAHNAAGWGAAYSRTIDVVVH